ncbi:MULTISPECIES: hypothetical protein [Roseomonadaceae]|uniref:DUF3486 family protein n=1 Tax=Falsiroseomonas oleicola TaxID=2801474 RepID=A0ABS6HBJ2_9PROT|nr:hypothetical protein [Roseomonas oleicola]MBU8545789.1 hypothetical protein [Roseomonas oleicola]
MNKAPPSPPLTPDQRRSLRAEIESALVAEMARSGPEKPSRASVARLFEGRGVSRATMFVWMAEAVSAGRVGQQLTRQVREAAATRIATSGSVAQAAAAALPAAPTVDDVVGHAIPVIEELAALIADTRALRSSALGPDGKLRNGKMFARAIEQSRRNLETAVKLQQAMVEIGQVERFHRAVVEEIAKESPELAQRVVARLNALSQAWGGA